MEPAGKLEGVAGEAWLIAVAQLWVVTTSNRLFPAPWSYERQ